MILKLLDHYHTLATRVFKLKKYLEFTPRFILILSLTALGGWANSCKINYSIEKKTKMKFRTNFNTDFSKDKGQKFKEPSETVQGDSLTVAELLRHYSSGILDDRTIKQSLYDYNEDQEHDYDDVANERMTDLTDIDHAKQYIKDVKTRQLQSQKQQQEKASKKPSKDVPGREQNEHNDKEQSDTKKSE